MRGYKNREECKHVPVREKYIENKWMYKTISTKQ